MKRSFEDITGSLKESIADYKYYTDFDKVYNNVNKYKVELNILNSLVGSKDIEKEFKDLIKQYPNVLKVIPLLLAVRDTKVNVIDGESKVFEFKSLTNTVDEYCTFMRETGLFELMETKKVTNLVDYVTGVEVGLDSNARKNRTGTTMEDIVESYIKELGIEYHKEMKKKTIAEKYNINLDLLLTGDDKKKDAEKRFDFVIKTKDHLYLMEVNFYSGGGSKLNETARSFKSLARDIKKIPNVSFIWITDGVGWNSARGNLEETFTEVQYLYTIQDLENNALEFITKCL